MTKSMQVSLGVFVLLVLLFFMNQKSQNDLTVEGTVIFSGSQEDVSRFLIIEGPDTLELVLKDSIWTITQADTLVIKKNQIEKLFDRVLQVKKEVIVSRSPEKWSTFGVSDSLGRQFSFFNKNSKSLGSYVFGNEGQDFQHNYIRDMKGSDVFRTNDNVYFLLNSKPTYWGKNPPKPTPEPEKIDTTSAS